MSTTSSSPRKPRTTGSSRGALGLAAALVSTLALADGCRRGSRETLVTYFDGDHGVSIRYPASWRGDQAEQAGVWYRYFMPPVPANTQSPLSVSLLAGPLAVPTDAYAQSYLTGRKVESSRPEDRQGAAGQSWVYASADGRTRYRLLLLGLDGRVVGLFAQGDAAAVEKEAATLDEMWSSLTIERPDRYPVHAWKDFQASLGVPDSWRQTQRFSGRGTLLVQFASPPLGVERRQTLHAALSVTLESAPAGGLAEYYDATLRKLGENYSVTSHAPFGRGYVDVMKTETPLAVSFIKRFYFAERGRACSLSFEARDDVFPRAARWADVIASTLRLGDAPVAATTAAP